MTSIRMLGGHKEWTSRKIDPRYSMTWMRERVSDSIRQGPQEDDMPDFDDRFKLSKEQQDAIPGDLESLSFGAGLGYGAADYFLTKEVQADLAHVHANLHTVNDKLNWLIEQVKKSQEAGS